MIVDKSVFMAYFTIFQDRLFPTAELPRGEREKIDEFLRLLEDSGVGEIIHKETQKDKSLGGRNSYNPYRLFDSIYNICFLETFRKFKKDRGKFTI